MITIIHTDYTEICHEVKRFWIKIDHIIHQQNHPYKYRNPEQIRDLLNYTADHLGLETRFQLKNQHIIFHPDSPLEQETWRLPELAYYFKKVYRSQHYFREEIQSHKRLKGDGF